MKEKKVRVMTWGWLNLFFSLSPFALHETFQFLQQIDFYKVINWIKLYKSISIQMLYENETFNQLMDFNFWLMQMSCLSVITF